MNKKIVIGVLLLCSFGFSQKLITRTGEIKFDASMPDLVEIKATNSTTSCILDQSSGDFVALALVKSFKFKVPLMEEHFNENYMESSLYPKATFKGKIVNFESSKLSSSKTSYDLEGDLTIHGITKKIKTKITISKLGDKVLTVSSLSVKAADYKIDIPSLVKEKFAENIKIALNFSLGEK